MKGELTGLIAKLQDPGTNDKEVSEAVDQLCKTSDLGDARTWTLAVSVVGRRGCWEASLQLLRKMISAGLSPSTATYNAVIGACAKSQKAERAVALLREMVQMDLQPTVVSYNAVIGGQSTKKDWAKALDILQEMVRKGVLPNLVTYNGVIGACKKGDQWGKAIALLQEMPSKLLEPNVVTYNAAISACEKNNLWPRALELFEEMLSGKGPPPNAITYSAAIAACANGMQWTRSLELLGNMTQEGLSVNLTCYNTAIGACRKAHRWDLALNLLREMPGLGLRANAVSFNGVIGACKTGEEWQKALELVREMPRVRIDPNLVTYSAAIRACVKGSQRNIALELLKEMPEKCSNSIISGDIEDNDDDDDKKSATAPAGNNSKDHPVTKTFGPKVPESNGTSKAPSPTKAAPSISAATGRRSSLFSSASVGEMNLASFGGYQVELETGSELLDPLECILFEPLAKRFAGADFQSTGLIVALHGECPSNDVIQEWGRAAQQLKLLDLGVTVAVPNLQMSSSLNSEDIAGLIDSTLKHCGAQECILIGKGWGGPRTITYAEENSDQCCGLILINPWTPPPEECQELEMPTLLMWAMQDEESPFDEEDAETYLEALNGRCAPTTYQVANEGTRLDGTIDSDSSISENLSNFISASLLLADMGRPENEGKPLSSASRRLSSALPGFLQAPTSMQDDDMVAERLGAILPEWIHSGMQCSAE